MDPAPAPAAPSEAPATPAQDLGFDWPTAVLVIATGLAVAIVIAAVIASSTGRRQALPCLLAACFAVLSVFKLMVAVRALREVRLAPQGMPDPREHFGSPARFKAWIAQKIVVWIVWMAAAVVLLTYGRGSFQ